MSRSWRRLEIALLAATFIGLLVMFSGQISVVQATPGADPYAVPAAVNTSGSSSEFVTTITTKSATVNIGNGVMARATTYNGTIPGPTLYLHVGEKVIVNYVNDTSVPNTIHWHGIELPNDMDGTEFTQPNVPPNGGKFLYMFTVTRPGIYWYHPHDADSTNEVFHGLYGMIVVTDKDNTTLQSKGVLPPASRTYPVVLSDTTVCKAPGHNDSGTYSPSLPWFDGAQGPLPAQAPPTPKDLCQTAPIGDGGSARGAYASGDIPDIQPAGNTIVNEGQTVLTNGINVGGQAGSPDHPGALAAGASVLPVQPGTGIRLELLNAATTRYMHLRLTNSSGAEVPLVQVGGQGGLLNEAQLDGGFGSAGGQSSTYYVPGEVVLAPGMRADVVAAIPATATGNLTLWTMDDTRTSSGADIPTVPVMHLQVTGTAPSHPYTISAGTRLLDATGDPTHWLGAGTAPLDPSFFYGPSWGLGSDRSHGPFIPEQGDASSTIALDYTKSGGFAVDHVAGAHGQPLNQYYSWSPQIASARYVTLGSILSLSVVNQTSVDHPFHLHGFSMQPISLTGPDGNYKWTQPQYMDTIDIPPDYTLNFKIKITDRPLPDGKTGGGGYGRWLFHCHIFFHATDGMLSELDVVAPDGTPRPYINALGGSNPARTIQQSLGTDGGKIGPATEVSVHEGATATLHGYMFDDSVHVESHEVASTDGLPPGQGGNGYLLHNLTPTTLALHSSIGQAAATDHAAGFEVHRSDNLCNQGFSCPSSFPLPKNIPGVLDRGWTWSVDTARLRSQYVYVTATNDDDKALRDQAVFYLHVISSLSVKVPGAQSVAWHHSLSFDVSAKEGTGAHVKLSAHGLPAGLSFTDEGNDHGKVTGSVTGKPGKYNVTIAGIDKDQNSPTDSTVTITVTREQSTLTHLSSGINMPTYAEPYTSSVTLTDPSGGKPIAGQEIHLSILGNSTGCDATTSASGTASCQFVPDVAPGTRTLVASFAGSADVAPAKSVNSPVTVGQEPTFLSYTGVTSAQYGHEFRAQATLDDAEYYTPIYTPVSVTFTLEGTSDTCTATTGSGGVAFCLITADATPGSETVVASFAGTTDLSGAYRATPFKVLGDSSTLTYTGSLTGEYHHAITASASLVEQGTIVPITGVAITFTLDPFDMCSATTNASGAASCQITPTQTPRSYTLTAAFAGDTDYAASKASPSVTITTQDTTLSVDGPRSVSPGGTVTPTGTLLDDLGMPIDGQTITFSVGPEPDAPSCTGTTNATGQASCSLQSETPAPGSSTVPIADSFAGDPDYSASNGSGSATILR
jgi:FtsP/CotA-like multicopper oxidase with cupredoxin domain